ncbi:MAG TPA: TetR/AcrR family transcriptional regulator [Acidimicrobiales bacterium]|nr:TetR/AcrR family transcriptional regulator [Acidimicrobiales bacterium]
MTTTLPRLNRGRGASNASVESTDGRRARGERTRLRVLDALLVLVEEGELRPTAQKVAGRAGVALRTVYHHFEDVEALRRTALDLQLNRHYEMLVAIDGDEPLEARIGMVTRSLRRLFEAITPIRRATLFDEHASEEMAEGLRRSRLVRRHFLEQAFSAELSALNGERKLVLDAIDAATSWPHWHFVRSGLGRPPAAAERVLSLTLHDLLTPAGSAQHSH